MGYLNAYSLEPFCGTISSLHFRQRREGRGHPVKKVVDCSPPKQNSCVSIEAETLPLTVFGPSQEVAKLLWDESPLKVPIMYLEDDYGTEGSARSWQSYYLSKLRNEIANSGHKVGAEGELEFSLVLGDRVTEDPGDWYGFLLRRTGSSWDSNWSEPTKSENRLKGGSE